MAHPTNKYNGPRPKDVNLQTLVYVGFEFLAVFGCNEQELKAQYISSEVVTLLRVNNFVCKKDSLRGAVAAPWPLLGECSVCLFLVSPFF